MRSVGLIALLLGLPAFACEQFRWFAAPPPQDYVQSSMVEVSDGFEGAVCLTSDARPMPDKLALNLLNALDSAYVLRVEDRVGTVLEQLVPADTRRAEKMLVPVNDTGIGDYRLTLTVTHPTERAFISATINEHTEGSHTVQFMDVRAYKIADAGRAGPFTKGVYYHEAPLQRPSTPGLLGDASWPLRLPPISERPP